MSGWSCCPWTSGVFREAPLDSGTYKSTASLSGRDSGEKDGGRTNKQGDTVDDHEIQNHSAHSDIWWNEQGQMKALHSMNKLRIPLIRDGLIRTGVVDAAVVATSRPLRGLRILDVGCGGGILTEQLARLGAMVTGVDASHDLIEAARRHACLDPNLHDNLSYVISTIEDHAETHREHYDAVVVSEVLEHVTEKELFLKACADTLKPGGSFFVTTFNKTFLAWISAIVLAQQIIRFAPHDLHEWKKFISPQNTQKILEKNNCSTVHVHGMLYEFLSNQWYWSRMRLVNYVLQAVKKKDR